MAPPGETQDTPQMVGGALTALAFLSIFSFFPNSLFRENEIFPYFLAPALLLLAWKSARLLAILGGAAVLFGGILAASGRLVDVRSTDLFQVIAVGCALWCVSALSDDERRYFGKRLEFFVYAVVAFMMLQFLFPSTVDFTYRYLVSRDATAAELQAYTGGVPGIAPEPAYMGSYLVGAWVLVRRLTGAEHTRYTLACALGILLTASLSASLTFSVILAIQFATTPHRILYGGLMVAAAVGVVVLLDSSLVSRVAALVDLVSSERSLGLEALSAIDASFGSFRLRSLVAPLSELGCGAYFCNSGEYLKGYSLFAVVYSLFAPLHVLLGLVLLALARDRLAVCSALLTVFYGPVLNWTIYAGLLRPRNANGSAPPEIQQVAEPALLPETDRSQS